MAKSGRYEPLNLFVEPNYEWAWVVNRDTGIAKHAPDEFHPWLMFPLEVTAALRHGVLGSRSESWDGVKGVPVPRHDHTSRYPNCFMRRNRDATYVKYWEMRPLGEAPGFNCVEPDEAWAENVHDLVRQHQKSLRGRP